MLLAEALHLPRKTGTWSPEAREAARRTYMAGVAALLTLQHAWGTVGLLSWHAAVLQP